MGKKLWITQPEFCKLTTLTRKTVIRHRESGLISRGAWRKKRKPRPQVFIHVGRALQDLVDNMDFENPTQKKRPIIHSPIAWRSAWSMAW